MPKPFLSVGCFFAIAVILSGAVPPAFPQDNVQVPMEANPSGAGSAIGGAAPGERAADLSIAPGDSVGGAGLTPPLAPGAYAPTATGAERGISVRVAGAAPRRATTAAGNKNAGAIGPEKAVVARRPPPSASAQLASPSVSLPPPPAGSIRPGKGVVIDGLGATITDIEGAKKTHDERKKLDRLYLNEGVKPESGAAEEPSRDASAEPPDLSRLEAADAAREYMRLAGSASAVDSPAFYQKADERAKVLSGLAAQRARSDIHKRVEERASAAIQEAAREAFQEAASGDFGGVAGEKRQAKALFAFDFWNAYLGMSGRPRIEHLDRLKEAVVRAAEAAKEAPEGKIAAPKVRFKETHGAGGPRLGFAVSFRERAPRVRELPAALPETLAIPETERPKLEAAFGDYPLAAGFTLAAPAPAPGLKDYFSRRRKAGSSLFESLVLAFLRWTGGKAAGLLERLKEAWRGFWRGETAASARVPAIKVAADGQAARRLRRELDGAEPDNAIVASVFPRGVLRAGKPGHRLFWLPRGGLDAAVVAEQEMPVRVARDRSVRPAKLRARFAVFNNLTVETFDATALIAVDPNHIALKTARLIHAKVSSAAQAYERLTGDRGPRDDVDAIWRRIEKMAAGLGEGYLLPAAARELVVPLEKPSLRRYLDLIRQTSVEALGQVDDSAPANMFVRLGRGAAAKDVALADISDGPLMKDGRIISPGLSAFVDFLRDADGAPDGSFVLGNRQFWGNFELGGRSAEVYADFLPPEQGGMLRIRCPDWGADVKNQSRLYYVAKTLYDLGFAVSARDGSLTAILDKDRQSRSSDKMAETLSLALKALHSSRGLDRALANMSGSSASREENARRIDALAGAALDGDRLDPAANGYRDGRAEGAAGGNLRKALNRALVSLGLAAIPDDVRIGQRGIDRWYNRPIEEALARGELRLSGKDGVERNEAYSPLERLAADAGLRGRRAARMARAVSSLEPGLFEFQPIGTIGALTAERAQRRLRSGDWLNLYVLRDPRTSQVGFARAELGRLGQPPKNLLPEEALRLLSGQGRSLAVLAPSALSFYDKRLREKPEPASADSFSFTGLAAGPADGRPVSGVATYDKDKAARGGYVFVTPYTMPDDVPAMPGWRAVVTTFGGLSSHAAVAGRERGVPVVILNQAAWTESRGIRLELPVYGAPRSVDGIVVRPLAGSRPVQLREGDMLRVHPARGVVEIFRRGLPADSREGRPQGKS